MKVLERFAGDPIVVDAVLSGLRGRESAVLEALLRDRTLTPERETAVTMLAATIVRSGQDATALQVLDAIGDDGRAAWQRSALLRGAEVALLGAEMPGTRAAASAGRRGCAMSYVSWRARRSRRRVRLSSASGGRVACGTDVAAES